MTTVLPMRPREAHVGKASALTSAPLLPDDSSDPGATSSKEPYVFGSEAPNLFRFDVGVDEVSPHLANLDESEELDPEDEPRVLHNVVRVINSDGSQVDRFLEASGDSAPGAAKVEDREQSEQVSGSPQTPRRRPTDASETPQRHSLSPCPRSSSSYHKQRIHKQSRRRSSVSLAEGTNPQVDRAYATMNPDVASERSISENEAKIIALIEKPPRLPRGNLKGRKGWVYVFYSPKLELVKIGWCVKKPLERKSDHEATCKALLDGWRIVPDEQQVPILDYKHLEALVHANLVAHRYYFECECGLKRKRKVGKAGEAGEGDPMYTTHHEWFAVPEDIAVRTVQLWRNFLLREPYGKLAIDQQPVLDETWSDILAERQRPSRHQKGKYEAHEARFARWEALLEPEHQAEDNSEPATEQADDEDTEYQPTDGERAEDEDTEYQPSGSEGAEDEEAEEAIEDEDFEDEDIEDEITEDEEAEDGKAEVDVAECEEPNSTKGDGRGHEWEDATNGQDEDEVREVETAVESPSMARKRRTAAIKIEPGLDDTGIALADIPSADQPIPSIEVVPSTPLTATFFRHPASSAPPLAGHMACHEPAQRAEETAEIRPSLGSTQSSRPRQLGQVTDTFQAGTIASSSASTEATSEGNQTPLSSTDHDRASQISLDYPHINAILTALHAFIHRKRPAIPERTILSDILTLRWPLACTVFLALQAPYVPPALSAMLWTVFLPFFVGELRGWF